MSENTKIEWCDHTFNPWVGCTKVSPACDHCYAEGWAKRSGSVQWGGERRRTKPANWKLPLKWNTQAQAEGRRYRVFCASLADVFDNQVPTEWREDLFALINATPHLDWLLLTKRIGNVPPMVAIIPGWLPPNVWIGATVCNQEEADRDIPKLLEVPARVRFLSIEPMLGPIDLMPWLDRCDHGSRPGPGGVGGVMCTECDGRGHGCTRLNWVIVGGESGPGARPMHPDWARSLRDQCQAAGVPFLFKQWGEWISADQDACPCGPPASRWLWSDGTPYSYGGPAGATPLLCRAGKNTAGRLLDGVQHDGYPECAP